MTELTCPHVALTWSDYVLVGYMLLSMIATTAALAVALMHYVLEPAWHWLVNRLPEDRP